MRRLLATLGDHPLGPLVTVAATTGLRQGELLGLTWADIDFDTATLTVHRSMARDWSGGYSLAEPKTLRSRRTIHLPALAVDALIDQQARQHKARAAAGEEVWAEGPDLVFTDAVGRGVNPWDVSAGFKVLAARAGVKPVPFHALRHSWATLALTSGVPLKVISDNLGHAIHRGDGGVLLGHRAGAQPRRGRRHRTGPVVNVGIPANRGYQLLDGGVDVDQMGRLVHARVLLWWQARGKPRVWVTVDLGPDHGVRPFTLAPTDRTIQVHR